MNRQPKRSKWIDGNARLYRLCRLLLIGLVALLFASSADVSHAQPYDEDYMLIVNTTADPGDGICDAMECTLREAIVTANRVAGRHAIVFSIPGTGPHTIRPTTVLPDITEAVIIDGYTQPGAQPNSNPVTAAINAVLKIEIDFSLVQTGLRLNAPAVLIRGLVLNRATWAIEVLRHSSQIEGNFLGVDPTGTVARPNIGGLYTAENTTSTIIGGSDPAARNLISGNTLIGLLLTPAHGVTIAGNFIGVDVTGRKALGNRVGITSLGLYTTEKWRIDIGGDDLNERNLISGNVEGVELGYGSVYMENNLIGTDITGVAPLGNQNSGLKLVGFAHRIRRNVFAYNGGNGVTVANFAGPDHNIIADNQIIHNGEAGIGVWAGRAEIQPNVIHSNNGLGIDLNGDGWTPNDVGDLDEGPNDLLNFPTLHVSGSDGAELSVFGTMHSKPNRTMMLSFYANPACDSTQYGEGEIFLTTQPVILGANGTSFFTFHIPARIPAGYGISATASDTIPNPPTIAIVTSEFAACRPIAGLVNQRLRLVATTTQYLPFAQFPHPDAPGGRLILAATFENSSDRLINGLFFKVKTLTNNNVIIDSPGGGGAGEGVLLIGPNLLQPGATFTYTFTIGLQERKPFDFFVDVYGVVLGGVDAAEALNSAPGFDYSINMDELQLAADQPGYIYLPLVTR